MLVVIDTRAKVRGTALYLLALQPVGCNRVPSGKPRILIA